MCDSGEVDSGDDWEESEDNELESGIGGLEGVVEPTTDVVVDCTGVRVAEEGGDLGGDFGIVEKGAGIWGGIKGIRD